PAGGALRSRPGGPVLVSGAPVTPPRSARYGANGVVAFGLGPVTVGLLLFRLLTTHTGYPQVLASMLLLVTGIALTMSPMTAAIMSAVPPRRAGAGSAMNDASRALGASLGIAVLGSLAAPRSTHSLNHALRGLTPADQSEARGSLGGALNVAGRLRGAPAEALTNAAHQSFVNGVHLAVTGGALLAGLATFAVARYLPRDLTHE